MRDVRDWNKYVDLVGKAVTRRTAAIPAEAEGGRTGRQDAEAPPETLPRRAPLPPRKGRGPRKEESREELLSRLLDPTLTLEETARILEVCPTTVRRYTNRGLLPHHRSVGNQRRFKLSSVLAFEAQMRAEGAEDKAAE